MLAVCVGRMLKIVDDATEAQFDRTVNDKGPSDCYRTVILVSRRRRFAALNRGLLDYSGERLVVVSLRPELGNSNEQDS